MAAKRRLPAIPSGRVAERERVTEQASRVGTERSGSLALIRQRVPNILLSGETRKRFCWVGSREHGQEVRRHAKFLLRYCIIQRTGHGASTSDQRNLSLQYRHVRADATKTSASSHRAANVHFTSRRYFQARPHLCPTKDGSFFGRGILE